jgi:hypothetical protein
MAINQRAPSEARANDGAKRDLEVRMGDEHNVGVGHMSCVGHWWRAVAGTRGITLEAVAPIAHQPGVKIGKVEIRS